eukprot:symbB.v1.2.008527.t1/scaffold532.1/size190944/1
MNLCERSLPLSDEEMKMTGQLVLRAMKHQQLENICSLMGQYGEEGLAFRRLVFFFGITGCNKSDAEWVPRVVTRTLDTGSFQGKQKKHFEKMVANAECSRQDMVLLWRKMARGKGKKEWPRLGHREDFQKLKGWLNERSLLSRLSLRRLKRKGLEELHLPLEKSILWGSYHSRFSTCATSGWMPAYHGTWFYGLWSILHHGIILESSNEGKGLEFWEPGVYVTRRFDTAQQYARPHQLFEDGNFYRCVLKVLYNPDLVRKQRTRGGDQVVVPSCGAIIAGVFFCADDPPMKGEERFEDWTDELEIIPTGAEKTTLLQDASPRQTFQEPADDATNLPFLEASDHGRQDEQNQLFPSKRGKTTKATNATKALKVEEDFVNGDALFGEAAKSRKMKRKMKKCQNHEVSIPGLKDPGKRRAPRRVCQKKTSKKRQRVQLAAKAAEVFHAKGTRVHERKKGNFQVLSRRRMALPPMEVEMGCFNSCAVTASGPCDRKIESLVTQIRWARHPQRCLEVSRHDRNLRMSDCRHGGDPSLPQQRFWTPVNEGNIRWAAFPSMCLDMGGNSALLQLKDCVFDETGSVDLGQRFSMPSSLDGPIRWTHQCWEVHGDFVRLAACDELGKDAQQKFWVPPGGQEKLCAEGLSLASSTGAPLLARAAALSAMALSLQKGLGHPTLLGTASKLWNEVGQVLRAALLLEAQEGRWALQSLAAPWPVTEFLSLAQSAYQELKQMEGALSLGPCACDMSLWPPAEAQAVLAAQVILEDLNKSIEPDVDKIYEVLETSGACDGSWDSRLLTASKLLPVRNEEAEAEAETWHVYCQSVTARHLVTRVAIFGEAMDFAAHALHVAMHEQMAQEIKNREFQARLYRTSGENAFPSGSKDFKAKQHFPQDFAFRHALRGRPSLHSKVMLPRRPLSGRSGSTQELPWLRAQRLRSATPSPRSTAVTVQRSRRRVKERSAANSRAATPEGLKATESKIQGAVMRCRLLGRADLAAVSVAGWQATFETELQGYLAQLLEMDERNILVRARRKNAKVSVHVSMHGMEKDAITLQQSLWDGRLRRLALRNCTGLESPWPTSQALRQFLLRDVNCEVFWVLERHEWHIQNFQQALSQRPYAMMTSEAFDLGGGTNLTLHLHPAGPATANARGVCLTLSAAGHGLPSFPFLLSAGTNSEIWAGPYGRDASHRFLPGGALCTVEELRQLHENCLVLSIEAVQREVPEWAQEVPNLPPEVGGEEVEASPAISPVSRESIPADCGMDETLPRHEGNEANNVELLRAVTEAAQGVQLMAASWASKPWKELVELVSATHQQVQDLAQQMTALQRAVQEKDPPQVSPSPPEAKGFRQKLTTALELADEQLLWHVTLHDDEDPTSPTRLLRCALETASGSTLDFQVASLGLVCPTRELVLGRSERAFEWSTLALTALTALKSCIHQEVPGRSEDELQAIRVAFVLEWPALVPWLVDPHRFRVEVQTRVLMDDRWWRNGGVENAKNLWVQADVTSRRFGPEGGDTSTIQSACLGVWQLTDDHPCHHMPRGEASSADGMPRTRVLGVGLMKAGTTVIWQALGAALNLSMGMDCEALAQGEVLDSVDPSGSSRSTRSLDWMMAKSLLSLCFGWVLALCAGSMDIHTAAPVQTDSYCARGYPICYYTLECLHGYSLECKSLRCDASEKVCEDFGGNFKASDWNGMCGTWEEVEDRYECCHCIGSMPVPQTVAPSTSFHRCYDSGGQCPDSFSGSCCYTRLTCPSGYSLSEPLGICGETECGIENYEASELNYMASDCNGVFPGDRVLCQTCVKDEGEMTTTTTLVTTQAPLTLVMTTVTTTPGISATSDYTAPNRSAEECDGHCSYPLSCPNGYHLKCHNIPCSDAKEGTLCNDLGEFYQVKSWSNCSAGDVNRYECCRCARQRPSTAEWELVGTLENGACRGRTPTDNSPSYYSVHHGVNDIEECKGLCLEQFPSCKGRFLSFMGV